MSNLSQELNPKIFDPDVERVSLRKGFGEGLLAAAEKDERIVAVCADLTDSLHMTQFKERFPERFIEVGVAEQNLAAVASGLAAAGKIPFIGSYAIFSPGRNWEQIRTTICYNNQKVVIVGSHGGVGVGADGGSHQALEDIALMRVLPRMTVLTPCDATEAKKATIAAAKIPGPVYIRLQRESTPIITTEESEFQIGTPSLVLPLNEGERRHMVAIVASGPILYEAIKAAAELEKEGIAAKVLNLSTIKPIDETCIIELAKECGAIVTAETHQVAGGAGSAVTEVLAKNYPVPIEFVGVKDQFGQSGTPEELAKYYELDITAIKKAVWKVLKRKSQEKSARVGALETVK